MTPPNGFFISCWSWCKVQALLCIIILLTAGCPGWVKAAHAAEILVVGDMRLKPVVQVVRGIREVIGADIELYSPVEVKEGRLIRIVREEGIRTVIALGRESINEALTLPDNVTVLYDLVILPPKVKRPNTAGLYMGTPIQEYLDLIAKYLPDLKTIEVIASSPVLEILGPEETSKVNIYQADNSYDFVSTVNKLHSSDALLLLPDVSLLTNTAVKESYLFSFRKNIPILGVSKKHVRHGALLALEFVPDHVGRRLGAMATASVAGNFLAKGEAYPSKQFNLYINKKTAEKMGITIPEEMLENAAEVYR